MNERKRLMVEACGFVLVVAGLSLISVALGVLVGGLGLIGAANFYMPDDEKKGGEHANTE